MQISYEGLFEAHITVAPLAPPQIQTFQDLAQRLGAKPILIELPRGAHPSQPMTASEHKGDWPAVKIAVEQLAKSIKDAGFQVVRVKVEAHPDALGVPDTAADIAPAQAENYFECHHKILLHDSQTAQVLALCAPSGAHLSKNAFKALPDGFAHKFVTLRRYGLGKKEALAEFADLAQILDNEGFRVIKTVSEYCVYDSFVELDGGWLGD